MKPSDLTKRQRQRVAIVLKKAIRHFEYRRSNKINCIWLRPPSGICAFIGDMYLPDIVTDYIKSRLPHTSHYYDDGYCWSRYSKRGITARINWLKKQLYEINKSL